MMVKYYDGESVQAIQAWDGIEGLRNKYYDGNKYYEALYTIPVTGRIPLKCNQT